MELAKAYPDDFDPRDLDDLFLWYIVSSNLC
jgi:hypothetical protein